jgi:hypothetical protein
MGENDEIANVQSDEDARPSSVPANTNVSVQGFDDEEAARSLGQTVGAIIVEVGRSIDLSKLDGVTVAIDYDAALAGLDRGMPGLRPLSRSDTKEMQGVAMSPAVWRNNEPLTHLVFNANPLIPLIWEGDEFTAEDRAHSIGIIAHECAHVQVTADKGRSIPDCRLGTRIEGYERVVMFEVAEILWDEYAACRLSAPFASRQNESHAQTLVACTEGARDQAYRAIRSYRVHGDVDRLVGEAGPPLCSPLKAAAYLLGGMDGEGIDWVAHPDARDAIDKADYGRLVDDLRAELRRLWSTRGAWLPTLEVFAGLEAIAKATFDSNGIFFQTDGIGQCRIDVPILPGAFPPGATR